MLFYPVYYTLILYSQMSNPSTSYLVRYVRTMTNVSGRDNLPIECDHITLLIPSLYRYYGVIYDDILPSVLCVLSVSPLT